VSFNNWHQSVSGSSPEHSQSVRRSTNGPQPHDSRKQATISSVRWKTTNTTLMHITIECYPNASEDCGVTLSRHRDLIKQPSNYTSPQSALALRTAIIHEWSYHAASAHGSLLASSHSEDPERPHVAAVCPLTTAACITQITRRPLSVGKQMHVTTRRWHTVEFSKKLPNQGFLSTTNLSFHARRISRTTCRQQGLLLRRGLGRRTSFAVLSRPPGFLRDSHLPPTIYSTRRKE